MENGGEKTDEGSGRGVLPAPIGLGLRVAVAQRGFYAYEDGFLPLISLSICITLICVILPACEFRFRTARWFVSQSLEIQERAEYPDNTAVLE